MTNIQESPGPGEPGGPPNESYSFINNLTNAKICESYIYNKRVILPKDLNKLWYIMNIYDLSGNTDSRVGDIIGYIDGQPVTDSSAQTLLPKLNAASKITLLRNVKN